MYWQIDTGTDYSCRITPARVESDHSREEMICRVDTWRSERLIELPQSVVPESRWEFELERAVLMSSL